jgi:hypothetical protein
MNLNEAMVISLKPGPRFREALPADVNHIRNSRPAAQTPPQPAQRVH